MIIMIVNSIVKFVSFIWNSTWFWKCATLLTSWWAIYQTNKVTKKAYKKKISINTEYALTIGFGGVEVVNVEAVNDGNVNVTVLSLGITDEKREKKMYLTNELDVYKESSLPKKLETSDFVRQAFDAKLLLESIQDSLDLTKLYGFVELSTGDTIYSDKVFNLRKFSK
ncbi:hypothetical protein [Lactiplantibacillus plantarum]|uniref:hypothetical protein n=1 Tax=Lactiplantibacillus plantarum TaxID=1590 RepID=UPI003C13E2B7